VIHGCDRTWVIHEADQIYITDYLMEIYTVPCIYVQYNICVEKRLPL